MNICPWDQFTPATAVMCEAKVCSWVAQPGNIPSAFAYFLVAFLIYRKQKGKSPPWNLRFFFWNMFGAGMTAFLYYLSRSFIFQAFDLSIMYFFASLLITSEVSRNSKVFQSVLSQVGLLIGLDGLSVLGFVFLPKHPGVIIFLILLSVALFLLFRPILKKQVATAKYFKMALLFLSLGILMIAAEKTSLCNPDNHVFQWHAAWNFSAAFACFFLYRHLSQTPTDSTESV